MKEILGLDTNILMIFSFLKAKEATTVGKAEVERCPKILGHNQVGGQTYRSYRFESHTHIENKPENEKEKHKQQKKVIPQTKGYLCNEKQRCFLRK